MKVAAAALAVAALAAGCGSGSGSATTDVATSATTATTDAAGSAAACSLPASAPDGTHHYAKPAAVLAAGSRYAIVMRTSCGAIRIVLDRARGGPIPNSIAFLTLHRFFDGLTFHRVVPGFVEQGGDPQGTGLGGPGYTVVGPVPPGYHYRIGDVAMAKTGTQAAGTAGSQFFVISGAQGAALPPLYGLLGHARDPASLATIRRIDALGVGDGAPSRPVSIVSARLVKLP